LIVAAVQYKKNPEKKGPLKAAYFILIFSLVIFIPTAISGYIEEVRLYRDYRASTRPGILGLIDNFATPSKPHVVLIILQILILLFYIGWGFYMLGRIKYLTKMRQSSFLFDS
jgi:hypothetical protein